MNNNITLNDLAKLYPEHRKLAVLIDADNAQASIIKELLDEISKFGIATIKRAYGDWTTTNLKKWKEVLNTYAIQPIQQFSYTNGKNSTDSALIIDAMDILHKSNVDGFCIVSSDSDFTKLASRIREEGLIVYGFGEEKTPQPFIAACNDFIYTENLKTRKTTKKEDSKLKEIIVKSIEATSNEEGFANLSNIANYLKKTNPDFDTRSYGYEKLGKLMKSLNYIEIREEPFNDNSTNKHIFVKIKN